VSPKVGDSSRKDELRHAKPAGKTELDDIVSKGKRRRKPPKAVCNYTKDTQRAKPWIISAKVIHN